MLESIFGESTRLQTWIVSAAVISASALALATSGSAQFPVQDVSKSASQTAPQSTAAKSDSTLSSKPPAIPVPEIIQKFGDRELEFKKERDNYTYTQTFVVQTIDFDGRADGEYRMTSDILFTPEGKRYEKVDFRAAADAGANLFVAAGSGRPRARATVRADLRRIAEVQR